MTKKTCNYNQTSHEYKNIEYLTWANEKFDDFLTCLFICSLYNIVAYGNAYAY